MNYELAKELKEAGLPQDIRAGKKLVSDNLADNIENDAGIVYAPTLSELIEACGEGFYILEKIGSTWLCCERKQGLLGEKIEASTKGYSTPEEAVARLWLALNNK